MTDMSRDTYYVYTDGACSGNPGKGGWGVVLVMPDGTREERSGAYEHTTNNRMELRGVIEGLRMTPESVPIVVTTDSQYVVHAFSKGWITAWRNKGWRTASKKPVANRDLWEELVALYEHREVSFAWVEGHAGHRENERCDQLAVRAYTEGPWATDRKDETHTQELF